MEETAAEESGSQEGAVEEAVFEGSNSQEGTVEKSSMETEATELSDGEERVAKSSVESSSDSIDDAERRLREWAHQIGFEIKTANPMMYGYRMSWKHKPVKHIIEERHRQKVSKLTGCDFRITLRSPAIISPCWHITTLRTTHNHELKAGTVDKHGKTLSQRSHERKLPWYCSPYSNGIRDDAIHTVYYLSNPFEPEVAHEYAAEYRAAQQMEAADEEIEKASRDDRLKISQESILAKLDGGQVACVYDVTYRLDLEQKKRQHVILWKDNSYICSCLLLQNNGIVCRYFFHLMQADGRFKFHVKLIPKRWCLDDLQDNVHLEETFGPFVYPKTQKDSGSGAGGDDVSNGPGATFMSNLLKAFPLQTSLSQADQTRLAQKHRHGEISSLIKDLMSFVSSNPSAFEMAKEGLSQVLVQGKGIGNMKDPACVKTKGRPKKIRFKSSLEARC
ncbi:hypothetical protein BGZ94_005314 [Podila epigama]|nr:hypothetical protein BGZ94_005314 [Podila epigama]